MVKLYNAFHTVLNVSLQICFISPRGCSTVYRLLFMYLVCLLFPVTFFCLFNIFRLGISRLFHNYFFLIKPASSEVYVIFVVRLLLQILKTPLHIIDSGLIKKAFKILSILDYIQVGE